MHEKISTIDQYWHWLEQSFVLNVRAQEWYNGEPPRNLSGFVNDKCSRLIGRVLMRQLRVKRSACTNGISSTCHENYHLLNEEKRSYEPGWINETTGLAGNSTIERAFVYRRGDETDQYMYVGDHATYSSGGYLYEYRGRLVNLRGNLSELHQLNWIDSQTRAIIIQFTLYNPNVQLFTAVTLLTEFLSTGGLIPQNRFEPLSFQGEARPSSQCQSSSLSLFSVYLHVSIGLHDTLPAFHHLQHGH